MTQKERQTGPPSIKVLKEICQSAYKDELVLLNKVVWDKRFFLYLNNSLPLEFGDNSFYAANLAGCCVSLSQAQVLIRGEGRPEVIAANAQWQPDKTKPYDYWSEFAHALESSSAARVASLLRYQQRFTRPTSDIVQLSLGCGDGAGEIYGIHTFPVLYQQSELVTFMSTYRKPISITLVDIDPRCQTEHEINLAANLAKNPDYIAYTKAITADAESILTPEVITEPANTVTMLRLDPNMIGSEDSFFGSLSHVITPEADLIITIGFGDDRWQWKSRLKKIEELNNYFNNRGLKPKVFDLTMGKNRFEPIWGYPIFAHHMALHCKLDPEALR